MILIGIAYILLAFICALYGKQTRIGFWGVLVLSIFISPVVVLAFLFLFKPEKQISSAPNKAA